MEVGLGQLFLVSPLSKTETHPSIPMESQPALVHKVDDPVTSPAQGSRPSGVFPPNHLGEALTQ